MIEKHSDRKVIEADFRMPEYRDAKPEDYEFRDPDGALVRKDRWEVGLRKIASILGLGGRVGFEVPDIVARVIDLNDANADWLNVADADFDYQFRKKTPPSVDLKLADGSILCGVDRTQARTFIWNGNPVPDCVAYARFRSKD